MFGGLYAVIIVAIVFGFTYSIIKMGIDHAEKIKRMKYGYPLKDGSRRMDSGPEVIDHRGSYGNNNNNQSGQH